MKVDFPTPGTPEMPTRTASRCSSRVISSRASSRCRGLVDSTSVIACETADRRPSLIPSRRVSTSGTVVELLAQLGQQVERGLGDDRARQEHRGGAHLPQGGY